MLFFITNKEKSIIISYMYKWLMESNNNKQIFTSYKNCTKIINKCRLKKTAFKEVEKFKTVIKNELGLNEFYRIV